MGKRYVVVTVVANGEDSGEAREDLSQATDDAWGRANADATEHGVAVSESCYVSDADLAAFGADKEGLPIYVVREA